MTELNEILNAVLRVEKGQQAQALAVQKLDETVGELKRHVAVQNGNVATLQKRQTEIIQQYEVLRCTQGELKSRVDVIKAVDEVQEEHAREIRIDSKAERSWLRDHVWQLAGGGGVLLGIANLVVEGIKLFRP